MSERKGYAISYRRRGVSQRRTVHVMAESEEQALELFIKGHRGVYAVMPVREAERDEAIARRRSR